MKWLDSLITLSLNPEKINPEKILPEHVDYLKSKIEKEKVDQEFFVKNEVFSLLDEKKIRLFINQYHSALIILQDQVFQNKKKISANAIYLNELFKEVIACIDHLLSFVELRFQVYIEPKERIAVTYLSRFRKQIKQNVERLRNELEKRDEEQAVTILLNFLDSFSEEDIQPVTFHQLLYVKELLKELEAFNTANRENKIFTKLDAILIYLNFNSKGYINYLIEKITKQIDAIININDKIDHLQLYFKEFNQLSGKQGTALSPGQSNLTDVLSNWFTEEIFYLERKLNVSAVPSKAIAESSITNSPVEKSKSKILCSLSTDQIGIILRSLDELQVIKAHSMSAVFKTIVPHLSTPFKEDLSYDAVRSKSYAAEERDKKIVIETLQEVIAKIKRY